MYTLQRFPPHMHYVAALPCEIGNKKCHRIFTLNVTICLTKIQCAILCNLPQKYRANDFT